MVVRRGGVSPFNAERAMTHPIHRIRSVEVAGTYRLLIGFDDGSSREIDFEAILEGELYSTTSENRRAARRKRVDGARLLPGRGVIAEARAEASSAPTAFGCGREPALGTSPRS
jgi:hypothetical protein